MGSVQATAKNEIIHQYLSAEKARRLLNWTPEFSLDTALGSTIDWYRNYFDAERLEAGRDA